MCLLYVAITRARQALHMVIQPPKKAPFDKRTASSLIYHALACEDDPTQELTTLYEVGDANWFAGENDDPHELTPPAEIRSTQIEFRQLPAVPNRNR